MKKNLLGLSIVILLVACLFRFYKLDQIPPGIIPDEADMGYSAYSLLHTGLSQYGTFNPLAIQEWSGGTHPPVYTYALIPLIKFFGLNIFIDRLPSAIFGIGTVIVVYYIAQYLFRKREISLLAAFLTAVNPWAIHLSRQGLLESVALFFVTIGTLFFLWASKSQKYYVLSAVAFSISLFSYDAPKIFVPLFIIVLIFYKKRKVTLTKKKLLPFLIIFSLAYLLIIKGLIFDGNTKDYRMVTSFNKDAITNTVIKERVLSNAPQWLSAVFHNKVSVSLDAFAHNYTSIFTMNWFFFNGSGDYHHSVGPHGLFHTFELPYFFIGLYVIYKSKRNEGLLLLAWLLIGAVPGGITALNNPFRSSLLLPVPILLSSFGIVWFISYVKKFPTLVNISSKVALVAISGIFILSYSFTYFFDFPVYAAEYWRVEENEAIRFARLKRSEYDKIFFTDRLENTYAFMYLVDPKMMQQAYAVKEKYKGVEVIRLDNIYFGLFNAHLDTTASPSSYFPKSSLIITKGNLYTSEKSLKDFNKLKTGDILYRAIETGK